MHLTKGEEKILKGEFGVGTLKAMELLVAIGDAHGYKIGWKRRR